MKKRAHIRRVDMPGAWTAYFQVRLMKDGVVVNIGTSKKYPDALALAQKWVSV